jgi:hypothetical protein
MKVKNDYEVPEASTKIPTGLELRLCEEDDEYDEGTVAATVSAGYNSIQVRCVYM